jgi:hypothetical protein
MLYTLPTQCPDRLDTHFFASDTVSRPSPHTETETETKTETLAPGWMSGPAIRLSGAWAYERNAPEGTRISGRSRARA